MNKNHVHNIQLAISSFFKVKRLEKGIIRLVRGGQFSNSGSVIGVFLALFLILFAVVLIIKGSYLKGCAIFPICFCIIGYVIDLRGVEIDIAYGKIRSYRSFFGLRWGKWMNIDDFKRITILRDSILEKRSLDRGTTYASSRKYDTHHFYSLFLVDDQEKHFIKLHEDESITRIRILATKFSELSKLELHQSIMNSKKEVV